MRFPWKFLLINNCLQFDPVFVIFQYIYFKPSHVDITPVVCNGHLFQTNYLHLIIFSPFFEEHRENNTKINVLKFNLSSRKGRFYPHCLTEVAGFIWVAWGTMLLTFFFFLTEPDQYNGNYAIGANVFLVYFV